MIHDCTAHKQRAVKSPPYPSASSQIYSHPDPSRKPACQPGNRHLQRTQHTPPPCSFLAGLYSAVFDVGEAADVATEEQAGLAWLYAGSAVLTVGIATAMLGASLLGAAAVPTRPNVKSFGKKDKNGFLRTYNQVPSRQTTFRSRAKPSVASKAAFEYRAPSSTERNKKKFNFFGVG